MQARVKATGEIVEIVGEGIQNSNMVMAAHGEWFTKDELDIVPLSWKPFEPTYWQKLEHQAAIAAMQGMLNNSYLAGEFRKDPNNGIEDMSKIVTKAAAVYARALVEKMKQEREG